MIVVLTGPSGSGKTVTGVALAASLHWAFLDADDLHDEAARAKMAAGIPLDDTDRAPWLARVATRITELAATGTDAVIACSALRNVYRQQLAAAAPDVHFVLLDADPETLRQRVAARTEHFMPPSLVASQLATLERSSDVPSIDATRPIADVVRDLRAQLGLG